MAIICVVYPRTIPSTFGDMNASHLTMEQLRIAYGLDALCKPLEKLDAIALSVLATLPNAFTALILAKRLRTHYRNFAEKLVARPHSTSVH